MLNQTFQKPLFSGNYPAPRSSRNSAAIANQWPSGLVLVEAELAHHVRWSKSKLVPNVFGERKDRGLNISGQHITISWLSNGEEETQTLVHEATPGLPAPD